MPARKYNPKGHLSEEMDNFKSKDELHEKLR